MSQRRGKRCPNEQAAEVLVEEIKLAQPNGEPPNGSGDLLTLASHFVAPARKAPQQRHVRQKFGSAVPRATVAE